MSKLNFEHHMIRQKSF